MKYIFNLIIILALASVAGIIYFYSQIKIDISKIVDYNPKLTTHIYDKNGDLVAYIFDEENRQYAKFSEIPPRIIEALIAIEDTAFFEHGGINYEAIFRAAIKDIQAMSLVEGASTLTQQLVKNMLLTREKKFTRKLKELIISYEVEYTLTKEQIIERYLNQVYFGHGYYGIKTAALGYFKKNLDELSLKEISMLVGLPKAPSSYDPTRHLDLSLSRANNVLLRMHNIGWITTKEYQAAIKETPKIYDQTLTQNKAPYLVDETIKQLTPLYPDIRYGGYKITLNADLKVQEIAQNALKFGYNEILKRNKDANTTVLNGAMIVTNPTNGDILALVGGVDYAKSNFNRATQSSRQPGSSFKPFIYQIALNQGLSPQSKIADISRIYEGVNKNNKEDQDWKPKNFSGNFKGLITLNDALKQSRNLATINLLNSIGLDVVQRDLEDFGFKDIPNNLSIALGSFGVSLMDYSEQYSIFPGLGTRHETRLINFVENKNGEIFKFEPKSSEIIKPEQAYLMIKMLQDVVNNGTGRSAKVDGIELAGKTGTTNESVDAWFCGFGPEIQVLIWYGNDNNTPMRYVEGGSRTAAPVFKQFMQEYINEYPQTKRKFDMPPGVYRKVYNGVDALYTTASPLPKEQNNILEKQDREGIIF